MFSELKGIFLTAAIAIAIYASGVLVIFTPLPILYESITWGRKRGLAAGAVAVAVIAVIYVFLVPMLVTRTTVIPIPIMGLSNLLSSQAVTAVGIGYFLFFATIALVLSEGVRRRWNIVRLGGTSLFSALVILAATMFFAHALGADGLAGGLKNYLAGMVGEVAKLNQAASTSAADIGRLSDYANEIASVVLGISPSLVFVFALVAVVVNLVVGRRFIHKNHAFAYLRNVAAFRLPDVVVWAVVAGGAAFFADKYAVKNAWLSIAAMNCLIGLGGLYFFQGLSVVVYFLQGLRAQFLRTLAYLAIILFFQTIAMVIVAVGVADVWVDFRMRLKRTKHGNLNAER